MKWRSASSLQWQRPCDLSLACLQPKLVLNVALTAASGPLPEPAALRR